MADKASQVGDQNKDKQDNTGFSGQGRQAREERSEWLNQKAKNYDNTYITRIINCSTI